MNIWLIVSIVLYVIMVVFVVVKENVIKYLKRDIRNGEYLGILIDMFMVVVMPISMIIFIIEDLINNRKVKKTRDKFLDNMKQVTKKDEV